MLSSKSGQLYHKSFAHFTIIPDVRVIVLLLCPIEIWCMDHSQTSMEPGHLSEALSNQSLNDDELADLGNKCTEFMKYEQALQFYDKAILKSLSPKASHYRQRGECHLKMKNWNAAIVDHKRALHLEPNKEDNVIGLRRAFASKICHEAPTDPSSSDLDEEKLFELGIQCFEANALAQALHYYTAAITKNPRKNYYIRRGQCHLRMRNLGAAELDVREVLAIDPQDKHSRRILSHILFEMSKFDEAIEEILHFDSEITDLEELGDQFMKRVKKFVEAFRCYSAALEKCPPGDPMHYCERRFHCYNAIKKQTADRAALDFQRILNMEPKNTEVRMYLVEVLLKSEKFADAMKEFKKMKKVEILTTGVNFMTINLFQQAVVCFTEFIERSSTNPSPTVYNSRGRCYRELGIFDKAVADFKKNIELQPHNWFAHADLCEVLILAGNIDEAKHVAQSAKKNIPGYELYSDVRDRIRKAQETIHEKEEAMNTQSALS